MNIIEGHKSGSKVFEYEGFLYVGEGRKRFFNGKYFVDELQMFDCVKL